MQISRVGFLCFGLLIGLESYAADNFGKELGCYQALIAHAYGANYNLKNGAVLIPGSKSSTRGFYIFTNQMSYFCEFPSKPTDSHNQFNYYYFELKIADKSPVYITYSDNKSTPSNPGLSTGSSPAEANKGKYVVPKCGEYLTEESRNVLKAELKARVATVKSTFDSYAKYMQLRQVEKPDKYKDALNTCMSVGGEVRELAGSELTKFLSAAPAGGEGSPARTEGVR